MPAVCDEGKVIVNKFEAEIYQNLCRGLRSKSENYIVLGPLKIKRGPEIDGLLITPRCVFTLEAKHFTGRIEKQHVNLPFKVYDKNGYESDLSYRDKSTYQQAAVQWMGARSAIKDTFGENRVFVKSLLILPNETEFDVANNFRDPTNFDTDAYILHLNEVISFAANYKQKPGFVSLDKTTQKNLALAIAGFDDQILPAEKQAVSQAIGSNYGPYAGAAKPTTNVYEPPPAKPSPPVYQEPVYQPPAYQPAGTAGATTKPVPSKAGKKYEGFSFTRFLASAFLAALAFFIFSFFTEPLISAGIALFILLLLLTFHGRWATYSFFGGLSFGISSGLLGLSSLTSILAGVLWPLALAVGVLVFFLGNGIQTPLGEFSFNIEEIMPPAATPLEITRTVTESEPTPAPGETPAAAEEAAPIEPQENAPAVEENPAVESSAQMIQIQGNSNVRAGPTVDDPIVGVALDGQVLEVLAISADGNWYQIELEDGKIGWIGSSRAVEINQ